MSALCTTNGRKTLIHSASGRVVGAVIGDTFSKKVRRSQHFLFKPLAIGFDVASIEEAVSAGALYLNVHDLDSDAVYRSSIQILNEHGFRFDRGFGTQIALPLERWSVSDPTDLVLPLEAA